MLCFIFDVHLVEFCWKYDESVDIIDVSKWDTNSKMTLMLNLYIKILAFQLIQSVNFTMQLLQNMGILMAC